MLTTADVLKATGGKLLRGGKDLRFTGVEINSRTIRGGELFVAIRGERFDGHDFSGEALKKGALGRIVREGWAPEAPDPEHASLSEASLIAVPDTLRALQDLAHYHRMQFSLPLVAVTGTNGKTSTKEMIYSILRIGRKTHRSLGNLNNHIGVPLSLFGLGPETRAAVVEFGMSGSGEITRLREIARPNIVVITNVSAAHLMILKNVEEIARAKAEILDDLPEDGWAVLNRDDPRVYALAEKVRGRVITFGIHPSSDVRAAEITSGEGGAVHFRLSYQGEEVAVRLSKPGRHQVGNALAAAAASLVAGVPLPEIQQGLADCTLPGMRWESFLLPGGTEVINDAYNANPASVTAALQTVADLGGNRRNIAVLGDMLELGDFSETAHRTVGRMIAEGPIARLIAVGTQARWIADEAQRCGMDEHHVACCADAREAFDNLVKILETRDRVLIKASRGVGLEKIVEELRNTE
ncbi:MAG: UDP-N-acetylmuramoyl-tripeptide--D-alanyl-D-alanine ligase [Deltaproteobacteria bacterium]|nr:UDP-N-acetylmuramoyl-tripeptide--D-alanyl-D-alanine ligase [Deltaproteobacteria bacterium]